MHWFSSKPGPPNDVEVRFLALLTATGGSTRAALLEWAKTVDSRAPAFAEQGVLAIPEEWWPSPRVPVPPIFKVLRDAYEGEWGGPRLDSIAKAMRALAHSWRRATILPSSARPSCGSGTAPSSRS